MRLFVGLKLDERCINEIGQQIVFLKNNQVTGNYTRLNNLHLTLVFIGEVDERRIDDIVKIINKIELKVKCIEINKITRLKDMIIGEIKNNKELESMYIFLNKELYKFGFNCLNNRSFYPHITLVREANKYFDIDVSITSKINKITLFESTRIDGYLTYIPKN